jgi:hypothetical protein
MFFNGEDLCLHMEVLDWDHFVATCDYSQGVVLGALEFSNVGITHVGTVDGCAKLQDRVDKALVGD